MHCVPIPSFVVGGPPSPSTLPLPCHLSVAVRTRIRMCWALIHRAGGRGGAWEGDNRGGGSDSLERKHWTGGAPHVGDQGGLGGGGVETAD